MWGGGGKPSINSYNAIESNKQNSLNAKNSLENNLANNDKYQSSQQNINTNISETSLNNTNQTPFHFNILTDGISKETKEKLKDFEKELNKIYPCKFSIYMLSDSDFKGLPKLHGNYLAYFRIKMASYLPQDIKTCLYLDVDMLCVSDIRGIFEVDLKDMVCGVTINARYCPLLAMPSRNGGNDYILNSSTYFNAGFMLVNLTQWRKENIEQKCFEWLLQYTPKWHDQDTLNAVLSDKIHILPLEWNFMIGHVENRIKSDFKETNNKYSIIYTYQEYINAKEKIKILHYLTERKPWGKIGLDANARAIEYPYRDLWWDIAFKTPIFYKDLQNLYMRLQEQTLTNYINLNADILAKHAKEMYYLRKPHKRIFRSIKRLLKRLRGKKGE